MAETAEAADAAPHLVRLSPAQEAMWLEQQLHPRSINGGFLSVLVTGEVTAEQVRAACLTVCEDNPQLRGLVTDTTEARLAVHSAQAVLQFEEQPLAAAPGEELTAARAWYREHRVGPWDLTTRSPITFSLLTHAPDRHTLVVGVHHIAFDGRSKFVFARQFLRALAGVRATGPRPPREKRTVPEHPAIDEELEQVVRYWLTADLATLPGLVLPRAAGTEPDGRVRPTPRFDLPAEHCARLRELTRRADVSFFTGLVACAAAVLHEYGNRRFVLGIPVDTSVPETRDHIGLQVNVVPCLIEVGPEATFRDLLASSGEALRLVHRHRRVPFSWVLRELRRRHGVDVSQGAFDRIGVSYPSVARDLGEVPGLEFDWDFFAPNSTRSFDLILQLRREGDAAYGRLDFTPAALDRAGAARFTADFTRLLDVLTDRPDAPLHTLAATCVRPAGTRVHPAEADQPPVARGSFPELAAVAATGPAGTPVAHCPVEQFLPTPAVAAYSAAGGRVLLDVVDPVVGRLGVCAWRARDPYGIWLTDPAPGRRLRVTDPAGRTLPRGVTGLLGVADDPRPGVFRAWIDPEDRVRLSGTADQIRHWVGRTLDRAEAEAAIAALPGVHEAAVVVGSGTGGAPRVRAAVVPCAGADTEPHLWRRVVRRAWPAGWPPPTVHVLGRLPRLPSGAVDAAALSALVEE
ncbi:condensation domain-containing protein [Streptomyces sp. NPDC047085]|uniref:condensation domain-containing protein n=1 Tax=Streptomyces sp. NPDC047085 TaxID=3155140 RepID=UPI0033FDB5C5